MALNKNLRDDPLRYSHYVHGCLNPWLQEKRDAKELQIGNFTNQSFDINFTRLQNGTRQLLLLWRDGL